MLDPAHRKTTVNIKASITFGRDAELVGPPYFVDKVPRGTVVSPIDFLCSLHSALSSPAA